MSLVYQILINSFNRNGWLQFRRYATIYTKTLNLPVTKFPIYVKKTKRAEHDGHIREVCEHKIQTNFLWKIQID